MADTSSSNGLRPGRAGCCRAGVLPLLAWLLAANPALGQTAAQAPSDEPAFTDPIVSPPPEEPFFIDLPVVLSATRLAQRPQDAPAATFVIDRDMIDASGAREIADLLRLAPGFVVASDGGNQRAVSYHGLVDEFGRRLQVLVDGRSVYTPFFGGLAWSDLPLAIDDIERIEVIRGPNSATNGANSFLGVVNILTRHPDASQGFYARAAGGEPDYRQGVLRHGFMRGPLALRYTLGHEQDEGFDIPDEDEIDGKELGLATFDAVYTPGALDRLRFQAGIKRGDLLSGGYDISRDPVTGVVTGREPTVDDPPRTVEVNHAFGQFDWEHDLGDDQQLRLLAYVERLKYDDDFPTLLPTGHTDNPFPVDVAVGFRNSRREARSAVEVQHLLQPRADLRLVWGGEVRVDTVKSPGYFGPASPVDNTLLRLFGNAEWRLAPTLTLNAGAMVEETDVAGTALSPRLALNYSPNDRHSFRLSASRSVRAPSLWEARWDQFYPLDLDLTAFAGPGIDGTPDLIYQIGKADQTPDYETVEAYEFGWLFNLAQRIPVRGDVKLFYERYHDLLTSNTYELLTRGDLAVCDPAQNPVPGLLGTGCNVNPGDARIAEPGAAIAWSFANQIDLDLYGAEASLEVRPSHRSRIIGTYSLTQMRNLDFTQPGLLDYPYTDFGSNAFRLDPSRLANYRREWSRSVPSHIFSLLAIHRPVDAVTLSASIYHVSGMEFLETGDGVPAYTRIDLRAARRFQLTTGWQAELYGVVQNIGQDYADFENKNRFDTRAFVGVKVYQ